MNPYINTETIQKLLESIKAKDLDKKVYSEIVDEDGNQYVDLVQEDGGVFGIALMGYSFIMGKAGIVTMADLTQHRQKVPKLYHRETKEEIHREAMLKIITSDITTKSQITFPEMSDLYWSDIYSVKPTCFVRASMSIPFFFYPYVIENIPDAGTTEDIDLPKDKTKWFKHTGYRGKIPEKVLFVDGGMLSNFPINAFHRNGVPAKPTFGARLSTWRKEAKPIDDLKKFPGSMISTMRQLHDYDFLLKNDDYNKLICSIECDA